MAATVKHHRLAWLLVAAVAVLTSLDGLWFSVVQHIPLWHGIYCVWETALTVGGDVNPVHQGYICLALAPVPEIGAALTLFTSALASMHVRRSEKAIRDHVTEQTAGPEPVQQA